MPRAKNATKSQSQTNGVSQLATPSNGNNNASDAENVKIVKKTAAAKSKERGNKKAAEEKNAEIETSTALAEVSVTTAATSVGRGRKKGAKTDSVMKEAVTDEQPNTQLEQVVQKKRSAKRPAAKAIETAPEPEPEAEVVDEVDNEQVVEVPVKTKGRPKKTSKKENLTNGAGTVAVASQNAVIASSIEEEASEEAPVEVKTRGRKKKEVPVAPTLAVEANDEEAKTVKVSKKRGRKASDNDQTAWVSVEAGTNSKTDPMNDVSEVPAAKRGKGKRAAKNDDADKTESEAATKIETAELAEAQPTKAASRGKRGAPKELKETVEVMKESVADAKTVKSRGGRKRAAPTATATDEDDMTNEEEDISTSTAVSKPSKAKTKKNEPMNSTVTQYNKEDFTLSPDENGVVRYNLKISSWNVAGLRSWIKKDGMKFVEYEEPDIFCLQEIKCASDQISEEDMRISGYHPYWLCMPGGYAGVAIYSKIMPINVEYGIGNEEFDAVGRVITAEYEKFFLINVYVPNSGRKLVNLEARMRWEQLFQEYVKKLDALKVVIICGDMNVSHSEIDLANPKANARNAGYTKEERDKMSELLALGFVDTFRHLYPTRTGAYTYWTYMSNSRSRNVGWRLDYFLISERYASRVVENCMRTQCMGSDHCPITLFLKM